MSRHPLARRALLVALVAVNSLVPVAAQSGGDPHQHPFDLASDASGAPLSIDDAVKLALTDQPILNGREATIDAEEQRPRR